MKRLAKAAFLRRGELEIPRNIKVFLSNLCTERENWKSTSALSTRISVLAYSGNSVPKDPL